MLGGIYTHQKCPICTSNLHDNGHNALACPSHPNQHATRLRVYFRGIQKRFSGYEKAAKFLYGLRLQVDENKFDPADYKKDQPNGFSNQVDKFLEIKKRTMAPKGWSSYRGKLNHAKRTWGNRNVKSIHYADIEDFLFFSLEVGDRTRYHVRNTLRTFFRWLVKRKVLRLSEMPDLPRVTYSKKLQNTVSKEDQLRGLEQLFKDFWLTNPRIYVATSLLCSFPKVRPMELMGCNEEHLDRDHWIITVPASKEGKEKFLELQPVHIALFNKLPRAMPQVPLFRYEKPLGGQKVGNRFGHHVLNSALQRSLAKIGIHGVTLYPFCKHSTLQDIDERYGFEEAQRVSNHSISATLREYLGKRSPRERVLHVETTRGQEEIVAEII